MSLDLEKEISIDYKKQAFLRDEGRCKYCNFDFMQSLSAFWSYTIDHVVAKCAGGLDTVENVVTCCKACNECLTRAAHLNTIDSRRDYIASREADRLPIYRAWSIRFGRGA